jgi:flagellar basal-body rod protein FlgG
VSKGIYTALSGALAQQRRVESVSNNLANVNTPGFKRDDVTFREHLTILDDPEKDTPVPRMEFKPGDFYHNHGADKSFAVADAQYTDYTQGSLKQTGRDLDMAIQGDAFFEVGSPHGVRFTRNGVFNRGADGRLVTSDGYPVLSKVAAAGGPEAANDIEGRTIRLGGGKLHVAENGDVFVNGQFVASIQLTEFVDAAKLQKEGSNLLRNTEPTNVAQGQAASRIVQRFVEAANVNPVKEMVELLDAQRSFEQNLKNIQHFDSVGGKVANDVGKL